MGENINQDNGIPRNLRLLVPTYHDRYTNIMRLVNHNGRILDLGCADGFYSRAIAHKENQVFGVDTNPSYLHNSSPNNNPLFLQASGENLPFKNGYFDTVLCVDVIEHIDPAKEESFLKNSKYFNSKSY